MIKQYITLIFRIIKREKVFSIINITGLSVGMASAFIILLFIITELTYDLPHKNRDVIYEMSTSLTNYGVTMDAVAFKLKDLIDDQIPQVDLVSRTTHTNDFYIKKGDEYFEENVIYGVDHEFFEIFTFPIIYGDYKSALNSPDQIIITESIAQKYFGKTNAMNEEIELSLNDTIYNFTIKGILKDMPPNSTLKSNFFVNTDIGLYLSLAQELSDDKKPDIKKFNEDWIMGTVETWVIIDLDLNTDSVMKLIDKVAETHVPEPFTVEYSVEKLNNLHFSSYNSSTSISGNMKYLRIFASIGILVLLIVSINYIILSVAKSTKRAKEISIRKVVGANKRNIIKLILGESIGISLITLPIAITLAELLLPAINQKLGLDLRFEYLSNWVFSSSAILLTVLIGIISGSYLAFYLSKFNPIQILKGVQLKGTSVSFLRKVLLIVQIAIFIFLLFSSIIIQRQFYYMKTMPTGYNKENVYLIDLTDNNIQKNVVNFMNELHKIPGVKYIGAASGCPPSGSTISASIEDTRYNMINAIGQFMEVYEFDLIDGRYFSSDLGTDENSIILNKEAVKKFELTDPVGKELGGKRIIGVVENFQHHSARRKNPAILIHYDELYIESVAVKLENEINIATIQAMEKLWKQFVKIDQFNISDMDEALAYRLQDDIKFKAIINGFTILAIFLACMGLFGSSLFMAEQRSKEIGIRKVFGSSYKQILFLINKQFIVYALISLIFAFPAGYYLMQDWLQNFASKIELSPIEFIIAAALGILIIISTISYIAIKYARVNPVVSLRYE